MWYLWYSFSQYILAKKITIPFHHFTNSISILTQSLVHIIQMKGKIKLLILKIPSLLTKFYVQRREREILQPKKSLSDEMKACKIDKRELIVKSMNNKLKIMLWNVYLVIPHSVIQSKFMKFKTKVASLYARVLNQG